MIREPDIMIERTHDRVTTGWGCLHEADEGLQRPMQAIPGTLISAALHVQLFPKPVAGRPKFSLDRRLCERQGRRRTASKGQNLTLEAQNSSTDGLAGKIRQRDSVKHRYLCLCTQRAETTAKFKLIGAGAQAFFQRLQASAAVISCL